MGAAFPTDDLQLLPASSPPRWIILLCQVCNYSLCHPSPGLGHGSRWEDVCSESHQLGAGSSRKSHGDGEEMVAGMCDMLMSLSRRD